MYDYPIISLASQVASALDSCTGVGSSINNKVWDTSKIAGQV